MDAPYYNGSDDRELGGPPPDPVERTFWKCFRYAQRTHALAEFFAIYDGLPSFQHLVDEAKELAEEPVSK